MAITAQEAWTRARPAPVEVEVPDFVREVVEEIAFQARAGSDGSTSAPASASACRSPLLENVVSNAERRALAAGETPVVPRVTDIYAALPSITGKFELEYEGELQGRRQRRARADPRARSATCSTATSPTPTSRQVIEWFDLGGTLQLDDTLGARELLDARARGAGPARADARAGVGAKRAGAAARLGRRLRARRPVRAEEDQPHRRARVSRRPKQPRRAARARPIEPTRRTTICRCPADKKKYYN